MDARHDDSAAIPFFMLIISRCVLRGRTGHARPAETRDASDRHAARKHMENHEKFEIENGGVFGPVEIQSDGRHIPA